MQNSPKTKRYLGQFWRLRNSPRPAHIRFADPNCLWPMLAPLCAIATRVVPSRRTCLGLPDSPGLAILKNIREDLATPECVTSPQPRSVLAIRNAEFRPHSVPIRMAPRWEPKGLVLKGHS